MHNRPLHVALAFALLSAAIGIQPAQAQSTPPPVMQPQDAAAAMKKLAFLDGSWNCTIQGGPSNGAVDHLTYSFTADGRWMIERSDIKGGDSSVQIWGYDPAQRAIIAHLYGPRGITMRTVQGWEGNDFVTRSDVNGITTSLKQTGPSAMSWTFTPNDPTQSITEACTR